jgi:hypothetical protein
LRVNVSLRHRWIYATTPIDVTKLAANDTNRQRILSCAKDTQSSIEFAESLHGCTFMRYLCLLENEFK